MNWVAIAVLVIIGGYAFLGWKKGLVSIALSMVAFIATVVLSWMLTAPISTFVKDNTDIYKNLSQKTIEQLEKNEAVKALGLPIAFVSENSEDIMGKIADAVKLPESLKTAIQNEGSEETEGANVMQYMGEHIALLIMNAVIFIILFIVLYIAARIIIKMAKIINKIPLVGGINKIGGLVAGCVQGFFIVWIACIVITMFSNTDWARYVFTSINESDVLSFIYNNNLIMKLVIQII